MTFDLVFYGATPGSVAGAYEARRQGLSAVIVGGWRDRHLGGMMSGGLGGTDLHGLDSVTGLARTVMDRIRAAEKRTKRTVKFEPRIAEQIFDDMVREAGVAVVWSDGVTDVVREGGRLTGLVLADGRRIDGRYFADCGYEGDLMALAGVSHTVGREARDDRNPLNGFRGRALRARGRGHNWIGTGQAVDPFDTPGDRASGVLPGLTRRPKMARGAADDRVQAYCFRMVMTAQPNRRVALPADPPTGFSPKDYELLFRYLAAMTDAGYVYGREYSLGSRFLLMKPLRPGLWDVNNRGPFSLDLIGGSHAYPRAGYAEREAIWKRHEAHIRGFFYALQHHPDPRVPPGLRDAALQLGLDRLHFDRPHPRDEAHWPYQLYVRESRRLIGDRVIEAADLISASALDRPVANGAYRRDSHHVQRYAYPRAQGWSVWNEGNFEKRIPGGRFSVPFDVVLPQKREIENLLVGFCVSATHEAFGGIRMEPTLMGLGQAIGAAVAEALAQGCVPVQDVDYDALRRRMSAAPDAVPFTPMEAAPVT